NFGIFLIKSLSVMAFEILLMPPIILLSPDIAPFAAALPKLAAFFLKASLDPPIKFLSLSNHSLPLLYIALKPFITLFLVTVTILVTPFLIAFHILVIVFFNLFNILVIVFLKI